MAKCFETWTVLEHGPLEKLSARVWSASGMLGTTQRRMTLVHVSGGRLLIHNPIALRDAEMKELEAWGKPAWILVPNAFHRQDSKIWKMRYPEARVLCPAGAKSKVAKIVPVDGSYDEDLADAAVRLLHFRGSKEREGAVVVDEPDATTLIVNDVVLNVPAMRGFMNFLLAPTGTVSVPRVSRWMILSDERAFAEHLRELARLPKLGRLVVGHGQTVVENVPGALDAAAARLG